MQTDLELLRSLAALMGWDWRKGEYTVIDGVVHRPVANGWRPWRPLEDMNDAWMVVEKMRGGENGYDYYIEGCARSPRCDAQFKREGDGHFILDALHEGRSDVPARAICEAALKTQEASK